VGARESRANVRAQDRIAELGIRVMAKWAGQSDENRKEQQP